MVTEKEKTLIRENLGALQDLPDLPEIVHELQQLIRDPDSSISAIEDCIYRDPVISGLILKVVNSSFYGFPRQISSIRLALVLLGLDEIQKVVFSVVILETFQMPWLDNNFLIHEFWLHSAITGRIAQTIASRIALPDREEVFLAGLLHDIGILALLYSKKDEQLHLLERAREAGDPIAEHEQIYYGFHHGQVGAWLANQWNLPLSLQAVIRFHCEPELATQFQTLIHVVRSADLIAEEILMRPAQKNNGADDFLLHNLDGLIPEMKSSDFQEIIDLFRDDVDAAQEFVGFFSNDIGRLENQR